MAEELQDIIERVVAGSRDETDIRAIVSALQFRQLTLVTGAKAVAISGDANRAIIVTGNDNIVIPEQVAELLQEFLAQLSSTQTAESASVDELVQQVRSHCCSKILNLYSKIQLLNRQQVDVDQLYLDVYLLEKLSNQAFATIPRLLKGSELRESDRIGLGNRGSRLPGAEVVTQHSRLMILGKPGSGKSTFLRRLRKCDRVSRIKRTSDSSTASVQDVSVNHCRLDIFVTQ